MSADYIGGDLWAAADRRLAHSNLMPSDYSDPVLRPLVLRYAEAKAFRAIWQERLQARARSWRSRAILLDDYSARTEMIEAFLQELLEFANELTEEDQRNIREGLTKEELTLFDILTKPEPALTEPEWAAVKKVCPALLKSLTPANQVLGRRKPAPRADLERFISDLFEMPQVHNRRLYSDKCKLAFHDVFEACGGAASEWRYQLPGDHL